LRRTHPGIIIDDQPTIRSTLRLALEAIPHRVEVASPGGGDDDQQFDQREAGPGWRSDG